MLWMFYRLMLMALQRISIRATHSRFGMKRLRRLTLYWRCRSEWLSRGPYLTHGFSNVKILTFGWLGCPLYCLSHSTVFLLLVYILFEYFLSLPQLCPWLHSDTITAVTAPVFFLLLRTCRSWVRYGMSDCFIAGIRCQNVTRIHVF